MLGYIQCIIDQMYEHHCVKETHNMPMCTDLGCVNLHLMKRIDCDEDVSNIRVDLILSIASLELLCDRVLKKIHTNR